MTLLRYTRKPIASYHSCCRLSWKQQTAKVASRVGLKTYSASYHECLAHGRSSINFYWMSDLIFLIKGKNYLLIRQVYQELGLPRRHPSHNENRPQMFPLYLVPSCQKGYSFPLYPRQKRIVSVPLHTNYSSMYYPYGNNTSTHQPPPRLPGYSWGFMEPNLNLRGEF